MMTNVTKQHEGTVLRVGFPFSWGTLTPALQHTAYADIIIKNQFEPLVRAGIGGKIEPLAASSWTVSPDFKHFTFTIDGNRKFSDGTPLTAEHFKEAWEQALSVQPKSANNSLQDLLYKVEGYEDFERTKKLSGITAHGDSLEIRFKTPFRMALDRLCGGRFGVYRVKEGRHLGTGSYVIQEVAPDTLLLTANPFRGERPAYPTVEIKLVEPGKAEASLSSGAIDLYAGADAAEIDPLRASGVANLAGDEVAHSNLDVNGLTGRFFANPKYRLALQALISLESQSAPKPRRYEINNFRWDPQVFLPVQAGRLPEAEVAELIERGAPYIDEFVRATQEHPLYYVSRHEKDWLLDFLKSKGVRFTENSGRREFKQLLEMSYKTHEPDLLLMGRSVASGDPDGIYHMLGRHGAIVSPMSRRERVAGLLEEGRSLLDVTQINHQYQQVSRAILEEVPFVHIGFDVDMLAFRSDRVRVAERVRNRKQFHFDIFEPL